MSGHHNSRSTPLAIAFALAASAACTMPIARADDAGSADAAEATPADEPKELEKIVVKGENLDSVDGVFSTTTIGTEDLRERRVLKVQDMYRNVPGMAAKDFGLPGVGDSIVIRGFGGGGHGGDLGVVIDGIPLNEAMSHADGYVDTSVIIPLEIDTMTVYRGPVSVMYGNYNRGGLISFNARRGGHYTDADIGLGSNALADAQFALGREVGADGAHKFNLAAQFHRTDGFRPQSDFERATLSGRWSFDVTDRFNIGLATRLYSGEGDNPGYLPWDYWQQDPYGIHPDMQNDGSDKNFATLRSDLGYAITEDVKLLGFVYATRQDFTRWYTRPVSGVWTQREETYDRRVEGGGVSLNGHVEWGERFADWTAGVETYREATDYEYYDGLDHRVRVNPAIYDRRSTLDSVSLFAQADFMLHPLFQPTLGVRVDRFTGDCRLNGEETPPFPCEKMETLTPVNPKLGLRSQVSEHVQLRASRSRGFALPGDLIKYSLGAHDLDPNVFDQTEVGLRFEHESGFLFDLVAFRIESTDEIVQSPTPGEYINFGETRRQGVEAELRWRGERLEVAANYGSANSEVIEHQDPARVGKAVTGVPHYTATLYGAWMPTPAWRFDATWRKSGDYWQDAANTNYTGSYATIDLGASWQSQGAVPYRIYAMVENATDKVYFTTTSYATGAPRTYRVGVQFGF